MKRIDPAVFEAWAEDAREGQPGISAYQQDRMLDYLTLCHVSAAGTAQERIESPNACQNQENAAVHAVVVRSHSILGRVLLFSGNSDTEEFHFVTRLDDKYRFDEEGAIPPKVGRSPPICGEIAIPIVSRDIVFQDPVRIASSVTVMIHESKLDFSTTLELTLVPEPE